MRRSTSPRRAEARGAKGGRVEPDEFVDVVLAATTAAPAKAREALTLLEGTVPTSVLDDARLIASELVGNSIRHAAKGPASRVRFRAEAHAGTVRIEVSDWGPGFAFRRPRRPRPDGSRGFGLFLVDRVASSWGVERRRSTRVWAEIGARPVGADRPDIDP